MTGRLHPDDIEAVALRMVELLESHAGLAQPAREASSEGFQASAEKVAQRYGVTARWVRTNAEKLGGRRIGTGKKPRHRFNLAIADERMTAMRAENKSAEREATPQPIRPRPRRRARGSDVPLLPIKGQETGPR